MDEWEIDLKELLVNIIWWNSKLSKKIISHVEKKPNFLSVYKVKSWEIKIRCKEHSSF
jgi:hypothetical protein